MTQFARRLDGVRIAFDVAPGARPVLLVHGFASTAAVTWIGTGWVRALAATGRGAITPDLRGHGQSDRPRRAADYAPRQMAADLVVVLDTLELERVDVIGYSLGSRVVAALARLAPERVGRLVLAGAGPIEVFETWDMDQVSRFMGSDDVPGDQSIVDVLGPAVPSGGDRQALLACVQGIAGCTLDVPAGIPQLFVAGGNDPVVAGIATLAAERGADYIELTGRTHMNALTAGEFKRVALEFLA